MGILSRALALGFFVGLATGPTFANSATGLWSFANGKVTIRIADCGPALCAVIVGMKQPIDKRTGKLKIDAKNPVPALRSRPVIGLSILKGMKASGDGQWKGAIYNPDDGHTYSATLRIDGNALKVEGCAIGFICKSNSFARVD